MQLFFVGMPRPGISMATRLPNLVRMYSGAESERSRGRLGYRT